MSKRAISRAGANIPTVPSSRGRAFTAAAEPLLPGLRALHRAGDPATVFEAWTVLAAEAFRQAKADVAMVEVGMGGRLDATTAWGRIILSVLTHVSLDHTHELGPDLDSICREKLAIARKGVPFASAETHPRLREMIRDRGREKGFPVYFAGSELGDAARATAWTRTDAGLRLEAEVQGIVYAGLDVALRGEHQVTNTVLAALAVQLMEPAGFPVPEAALRRGLASVYWPGRLERVARHPDTYLDGAHNPDAALVVAHELLATGGRAELVIGIMADKDVANVTKALGPVARRVWTVTPPDARGLPAPDLAAWFQMVGIPAEPMPSFRTALEAATRSAGRRGTVLVAGSLYNIEPARAALARLGRLKSVRPRGRR